MKREVISQTRAKICTNEHGKWNRRQKREQKGTEKKKPQFNFQLLVEALVVVESIYTTRKIPGTVTRKVIMGQFHNSYSVHLELVIIKGEL